MSKNPVKTILITLYLSAVQDPEPLFIQALITSTLMLFFSGLITSSNALVFVVLERHVTAGTKW